MSNIDYKIKKFLRKKLFFSTNAGLINFLVISSVIWLSSLLVDVIFYFSESTRWLVLIINSGLTIYVFYRFLISYILDYLKIERKKNYSPITKEIGQSFPEIADRLTNVYQLQNLSKSSSSDNLRNYAIKKFGEEIKSIDFSSKLKFSNFTLPRHVILLISVASIITTLLLHDPILFSLKRVLVPYKNFTEIPKYEFQISPGNKTIIAGESINIYAKYSGPNLSECLLQIRPSAKSKWQTIIMSMDENNYYVAKLDHVANQLIYRIKGKVDIKRSWSDKLISDEFTINSLIPPLLSDLQIEIIPPKYTKLPVRFLNRNIGDCSAYPGSILKISAMVNKEIKKADIIFSDSTSVSMAVRDTKVNSKYKVHNPVNYQFKVIDLDNVPNQNPIEYSITTLEDYHPTVNIIEPEKEIEMIPDAAVNLQIEANDDFGFSDIKLYYQILTNNDFAEDSTYTQIKLPFQISNLKYFLQNYLWNISVLPVGFDETIKYYVVAWDNDQINGPKSNRTNYYYIHFPSLEQLFDEFADAGRENIRKTEDLAEESENLKKELEKINRELKREEIIDWEKKKEIESTLQKQKEINEKLKQLQQDLEKAIEKLAKKNLLSPEILQKYQQLQQLFQEIASPELLNAMQELQKSFENLDKKEVSRALNNIKINQEQFKQNLERTLELFKKVQLEQEIDRLVQLAKSLLEKQNEISENLDETSALNDENKRAITEKQNKQSESLNQLEKSIEDILKDMSFQSYEKAWQDMEEAYEIINKPNMISKMKTLKKQISQGQKRNAHQNSKNLGKQLEALVNKLQQSQKNMVNQDKNQIMAKMKRSTTNLLNLSKNEESLMQDTKNISNFSDRFREIAQSQQSVSENMSRVIKEIIDLSKETFFLSPQLSKALGRSQNNMRNGLKALEERNKGNASKFQIQAMASLNQAVIEMQNSMQMMSQSNSARGFEQFMKRMQQMSGQQGQLNKQSLDLMQGKGNSGTFTLEQQGEMARMAATQQALRKSLEQLNEEMGERSDVLGRMDKVTEDMEKVAKDLESLKIDRKTIERQQRILSRMLDAQRSVREREYSRQRKAEVGKIYARKRPSADMDTLDEKKEKLRKELKQALDEGYSIDYEKLIEEYFRKLNSELEKK